MARRKVTMLEAFQRSARESAERAAAERRRVIAEREKEIRRSETARAAQEFSSRLSQRAGDSVGSLIAGIRGGAADVAADPSAGSTVPPAGVEGAEASQAASSAAAPDIHSVPAVAPNDRLAPRTPEERSAGVSADSPAVSLERSGPALPSFDRAVQPELPDVSTASMGSAGAAASTRDDEEAPSVEPPASAAEEPELEVSVGEAPEDQAFADASHEEVEEAIAALESEVLELPMSPKTFAILGLAAVAAVFMIGFSFGNRERPRVDSPGDSGFLRAGYGEAEQPRSGSAHPLDRPWAPRGTDEVALSGAGVPSDGRAVPSVGAALPAESGPDPQGPDPRGPGTEPTEPTGPVLTHADMMFQDAKMNFTILAITYTRTEAHAQLAMETYNLLHDEGFPVIHPIEKGSRIYVFVGAAEKMGDLEGLKQELQDLRSGQRREAHPFRTAYLVNTDPYR